MGLGRSCKHCNNFFACPFALVNSTHVRERPEDNPKSAVFVLSMAPVLVRLCPGLLTPAFIACSTRQSQDCALVFLRNLEIGTQIARNAVFVLSMAPVLVHLCPGLLTSAFIACSTRQSQDCALVFLRNLEIGTQIARNIYTQLSSPTPLLLIYRFSGNDLLECTLFGRAAAYTSIRNLTYIGYLNRPSY